MSFAECAARSFTVVSVLKNAPQAAGVYGLCNSREWVLVGHALNIQASLLEYLRNPPTESRLRPATGFVFEVCDGASLSARHKQLIQQFRPSCNQFERPR